MRRTLPRLAPVCALMILSTGCEGEKRVLAPGAGGTAEAPPAAPSEAVQLRPVLNERTTDIRDAGTELQQGGQVASGKIVSRDPITLPGNAYVSIVGQASILQIKHALDLYYAQNERYPATLDEFMNEIIRPNGIALPQLPYYQEYAYDAENHQLVVMEYPERKEQFQRQQDERFGRN